MLCSTIVIVADFDIICLAVYLFCYHIKLITYLKLTFLRVPLLCIIYSFVVIMIVKGISFLFRHFRLKNSPIIAFGRSLGGAVSVSLASRHPNDVKAVILENTFLSVAAMVDVLMPYVASVKSLILRIKWDSDVKIQNLKQPIFFISGVFLLFDLLYPDLYI